MENVDDGQSSLDSGQTASLTSEGDSKVFQEFYPQLVKILPMNDITFIAQLFSVDLLPGDAKDLMDSQPTQASKASWLLDHMIKPSVQTGAGRHFHDLIKVMEDSEYTGVKEIAKLIKCKLRKQPVNHENGAHSTCNTHLAMKFHFKSNRFDVSRLQARYLRGLPTAKTGWPKHHVIQYVRLALVEKEDVTLKDKNFDEFTKSTLNGEVDKILKKKKPLGELRDIFFYQSKPCPRLILILGSPGIGKTTLASEICVRWARDGFLAEDFDIVILLPLMSVQGRSLEKVMVEHIGEETYEVIRKSAGSRCLMILEGFDEMAAESRENDPFLIRVMKECTLLEEVTIIITSRPHACKMVDADRRIEVVGFGKEEIRTFVKQSFPDDVKCVEHFLRQLKEYPHLESLSYVPMNLVMIVDIFKCSEKKLPSTVTELYQLFIVMKLQRQVRKEKETRKAYVPAATAAAHTVEEKLCKVLTGVPKEAVMTLFSLCRLAYHSIFDWDSEDIKKDEWLYEVRKWMYPRIIFTVEDLNKCGIEVAADDEWDGYGLLTATPIHQLPTDTITYNFSHLTIQEFLCAVYISTLPQEEQQRLLSEHFVHYCNVFIFLCGLTGLVSDKMVQHVLSELSGFDAASALRCLYDSQRTSAPPQITTPIELDLSDHLLQPYDCLCISYVLSCYPVSHLDMSFCNIEDKGAEMLVKHYSRKNSNGQPLTVLNLSENNLTLNDGLMKVLKIVKTSHAALRVLCVSGNPIGDDGMSLISSELKHNKVLLGLEVMKCGLSAKGAICISKVLGNCSLKVLNLSDNKIGDDGITAIAGALGNSQINTLGVCMCDITLTGAKSLARGLTMNSHVKMLSVFSNPITVEGARLLVQSAVDSRTCEEIIIYDKMIGLMNECEDHRNDDEVKRLMTILEERKRQEEQKKAEVGGCFMM